MHIHLIPARKPACISQYFDAWQWIYYERAHSGEENVASNKVNVDVLHRNEERKICKEVLYGRIKLETRCEGNKKQG